MKSNKNQSQLKKIFNSKIFLIVLIVLTVLVGFSTARAFYQDYRVNQEIARLNSKVDDLEQKKLESMQILEYVSSKNFVEKKARSDLHMKKPGEKVAVVKEEEKKTEKKQDIVKLNKNNDDKKTSNPAKWWNYFVSKSNN
jgi:cell division protein FtsL